MSPQYTVDWFADISTRETCTSTQKVDRDQMSERRIRTLMDTNMMTFTFCCKFGFIRFVWPCLDDICDLKWRIKCPRNFRQSSWIFPNGYISQTGKLHTPTQTQWHTQRMHAHWHYIDTTLHHTHTSDRTTNRGPLCVFVMHAKRSHAHVKYSVVHLRVRWIMEIYTKITLHVLSVWVALSVELSEEEDTKTLINRVDCQHSKLQIKTAHSVCVCVCVCV